MLSSRSTLAVVLLMKKQNKTKPKATNNPLQIYLLMLKSTHVPSQNNIHIQTLLASINR